MMNDKLSQLIADATSRTDAAKAKKEDERRQRDLEAEQRDTALFRRQVENAFGSDILEAIGPFDYGRNIYSRHMTFQQGSRFFRVSQVSGALVQVEETNDTGGSYKMCGHQFNLTNTDAKDSFLTILGEALKHPANI
jgi:hypothetical protein